MACKGDQWQQRSPALRRKTKVRRRSCFCSCEARSIGGERRG
uniref:Uncharacterized protein n=1 Tax=Arundo donax TaxID=35708 RepID=A0A0A8ZS34_ARUDO